MARVTVDQKALTDPRFRILGSNLSPLNNATREDVETAFGLWLSIRVWDYCTERGLLTIPARDLEAFYPGLTDALLDAGLVAKVPRSRTHEMRICGGEGRLDWLERKRSEGSRGAQFGIKGAEFGKLGGRPKKTGDGGVLETPVRGDTETPPLTLTPAPTPTLTQEKELQIERRDPPAADASPSVMTFPVNGGSKTWTLTKTQVEEWTGLYPGLDVIAECSKSLAWVRANRRKTASGMPKFLVGWLNRANDAPQTQRKPLKIDGAYRETKPRPLIDEEYSKRYSEARAEGKTVEEAAAFASSAEDRT